MSLAPICKTHNVTMHPMYGEAGEIYNLWICDECENAIPQVEQEIVITTNLAVTAPLSYCKITGLDVSDRHGQPE